MSHPAQSPVHVGNSGGRDSRDNLSDVDEDYDMDKLITHEMYDSKQPHIVARHTNNAEVVAYHSVEKILDNVARILHEKYINSKLDGHILESTYDLVELLFSTEFITYDNNPFADSVDTEPPAVAIDNWGRSKIGSKKPYRAETKMEFSEVAESMISEDKKALQKAKDVGKKLIRDAKSETMPAPLDLQEPVEINKTEDDLRQVKERERKRQDEERAAELIKKRAETQAKFKTGNVDLKKKPFTYDYNGVPILINNAKVEKFPPSAYLVQHIIQDPESENPKDKKKKAQKEVAQVRGKQKRAPETEQEFVRKYGIGVPTYDLLEPQVGVTYVENGKTKNSVKTRYNLTSMTSGSLISTLGGNPRLTKTEYLQLTKGGNLSRTTGAAGAEKDLAATAASTLKSGEEKRIPLEAVKEQWGGKTGNSKEIGFGAANALRMSQTAQDLHINPEKMDILLKASEEIKQDTLNPKQFAKTEKFSVDESLKRSPIDTFNLELLNSKDWGKNTYLGNVNSLPKLPSHKMQLEQTLGIKAKPPRNRATNLPMQKDYSELLMATLKSQQMA